MARGGKVTKPSSQPVIGRRTFPPLNRRSVQDLATNWTNLVNTTSPQHAHQVQLVGGQARQGIQHDQQIEPPEHRVNAGLAALTMQQLVLPQQPVGGGVLFHKVLVNKARNIRYWRMAWQKKRSLAKLTEEYR